jgi:hypothetical protein
VNPRVSVALCTHNGAVYVAEQLQSILEQQPPPFEVVVSDDASTDATADVVKDVVAQAAADFGSTRVRLIRNDQVLGTTKNFEQALLACTGDFIALSDQDDVWLPGRLAALTAPFADESVLLVSSDAWLVSADGSPFSHSLFAALGISARDIEALNSDGALAKLLQRNLITGATSVVRRSLIERAAPFPEPWVHDEWLAVVAAIIGRIHVVPQQLTDYRQHGANQIGARRLTLRQNFGRLTEPREGRYIYLLHRARALFEQLDRLGATQETKKTIASKVEHQQFRATLPAARRRRVLRVLAEARSGRYSAFGRGTADVVRDLVQPNTTSRTASR